MILYPFNLFVIVIGAAIVIGDDAANGM